jgi:hypothetical protein
MKGIVFTELLEMVETKFGLAMVEKIISEAGLDNGGAYTAVGQYDYHEMLRLVTALSDASTMSVAELEKAFGRYLFERFSSLYGRFFVGVDSTFAFLSRVHDYVHAEVLKLYPEAELPNFTVVEQGPHRLVMMYESPRPFADLAEGLILGCIEHFKEQVDVTRQTMPAQGGSREQFTLQRLRRS